MLLPQLAETLTLLLQTRLQLQNQNLPRANAGCYPQTLGSRFPPNNEWEQTFLIMEYICVAFVLKGILTVLFPSKPGTTKCSSSLNDHWGQVSERRLFLWALAWSCVTDFQLTSRPLSDFYLRLTAFVDFAKTEQIQGVVTYFSHNKLLQSISDSSQTSSRRKKQTDVSRTFGRKAQTS